MSRGKRFYKRNNNGPAGQGAPEQSAEPNTANANGAAGGNPVKNYEGKPRDGQGGKPGKPGGKPFNKPAGKPPRRFMKEYDREGNKKDRNENRQGGKEASRGSNGERRDNRPRGNGAGQGGNGNPNGNRHFRPRFENRKPQLANKVLVAYYSWSGVTEKAAQRIVSVVKGNSYRIVPVKAYPSMYGLCVAKAGMEKASGARPELKGTLPDCSRYEKIAIGFPIWWFNCPNIILSFLEKVNLEGKKVYPFCTSKSSGPRGSADTIRNTVSKADVKDCLDANKLADMSDEDIKKWLEM